MQHQCSTSVAVYKYPKVSLLLCSTQSEVMLILSCFVVSIAPLSLATPFWDRQADYNDGVHLAVSPKCGTLGGNFTDVNAGIDLHKIKTIVSFGVCEALYLSQSEAHD